MPQYCTTCGGKGQVSETGIETCHYCAGTGRDRTSDLWAFPCSHCNGKGQKTYCRKVTCKACYGTGLNHF